MANPFINHPLPELESRAERMRTERLMQIGDAVIVVLLILFTFAAAAFLFSLL